VITRQVGQRGRFTICKELGILLAYAIAGHHGGCQTAEGADERAAAEPASEHSNPTRP